MKIIPPFVFANAAKSFANPKLLPKPAYNRRINLWNFALRNTSTSLYRRSFQLAAKRFTGYSRITRISWFQTAASGEAARQPILACAGNENSLTTGSPGGCGGGPGGCGTRAGETAAPAKAAARAGAKGLSVMTVSAPTPTSSISSAARTDTSHAQGFLAPQAGGRIHDEQRREKHGQPRGEIEEEEDVLPLGGQHRDRGLLHEQHRRAGVDQAQHQREERVVIDPSGHRHAAAVPIADRAGFRCSMKVSLADKLLRDNERFSRPWE